MNKQWAAAWMLPLMASWAVAAPVPVEHFFKNPALHEVLLSPSGKRMAMSVPAANGRVGVFTIDLQGNDFPGSRAIVFSDGDVPRFQWVDDERIVFSVTDLQATLGKAYEQAPGLYAVRYDGKDLRYLVEIQGRPFVTGTDRIKSLPWNHMLLHVPAPSEDQSGSAGEEVIVGEMSFVGNELNHLAPMWLNTRTAKTRPLSIARVPCGVRRWWFSAQGEPRAALCVNKGRESLHWYRPAQEGKEAHWTLLAEGPLYQMGLRPQWVGQGDTLYVEHHGGAAGESVVAPFDFSKNAPGATLINAPGFDFEGSLLGDREGKALLGVRLTTDAEQTIWFDAARKAAQEKVDAALPGRVNRIQCRRCGSEDAVILVRSFSDRDPGQLFLWRQADDGGKGRWHRVGKVRPEIQPEQMAGTDLQRIRTRDGRDLPVWITRPAKANQALPAVVLVHGGPWVRGRRWDWQEFPQFLASRGYVVIEPEFRGSDGYGQAHLRAGFKQWGQAMQDDVADALLWAQKEKLASSEACIVGASYGGYSTLMGLIRHPELYRCGSAWVAVTDPFLFLEGSWWVRDDISRTGRRYGLPQMVGDVDKDRDMLLANSPLAQAARIKKPLQLIWGSDDQRVPIQHGKRLREAMQTAGQEPEWIVFEGEAHGVRKTENQVELAKRLEAFLAKHLGPASRP
ncbi:MAG: S9 family peptidase [Burkholderiales bacterium]|nr:S9 family peptidase [Burkholderiales bacterium]